MTDEQKPEETSAVKPQVIDLDAEDIKVESDSTDAPPFDAPPPMPKPPARKLRNSASWIAAALLVGLVAGGWIYRDVLSAYFPGDEVTALKDRVDVLEANGKTLGEQLVAVSQSAETASRADKSLDDAIKATANDLGAVSTRIGGFEARIADAENTLKTAKADLDALRSAVSSGTSGSGTPAADSAALAAIGQRIDALEKDVASLKSGSGGSDSATLTTALSQSLADLKAKIAAGAPFAEEFDRIARMVPAAAGLDVLAAHAAQGLPTAPGLAGELRAAIPALPQPEAKATPAEESYWDTIMGALSGIITIRDIGTADWPQLAEKAAALAESGDLVQAIALLEDAEGDKPPEVLHWRDRAAARLKLDGAIVQVSEAVLRQIAALGGAQ